MQVTLTRRDNNGDSLGDKGHEWRGDPIIVWWTSNVGDLITRDIGWRPSVSPVSTKPAGIVCGLPQ